MEKKLTHSKWFLYLTEFFAGMSVMAVELGAVSYTHLTLPTIA